MRKETVEKLVSVASVSAIVLATVYAVVTAKTTGLSHAHGWFWAFAGFFCLAEGAVLYTRGIVLKIIGIGYLVGVVLMFLGFAWLFADIVFNGGFDHTKVGGGIWIGLLLSAVISVSLFILPILLHRKKRK